MTCASPLLVSAIAALECEANENINAAVLLNMIRDLHPFRISWAMLEVLNHFEGSVRSRPALIAVLLRELSAAFPVPRSLLQ